MPSLPIKHDPIVIVGGGWRPSARLRDAPNASGRLTSFSVKGRESRALLRIAGMSIVDAGSLCLRYTL